MSFYKYFPGNCSSPLSFSVIWFTILSAFLDWRLCLIILQLELLDLIISLSEQFLPFEFFTCKNISWFLTFQSTFIVKNVNAVPVVIFCFLKYAFSYCSLYLIMIFLKLFLSEEPFTVLWIDLLALVKMIVKYKFKVRTLFTYLPIVQVSILDIFLLFSRCQQNGIFDFSTEKNALIAVVRRWNMFLSERGLDQNAIVNTGDFKIKIYRNSSFINLF